MRAAALPSVSLRLPEISRQILSLGIGLAASWLIFFGLSRVQYHPAPDTSPAIEDLRTVEIPMEPPPPPVRVQEVPVLTASSLIIVAPERSESVVKLPDVPILRETVPPVMGVPEIDFAPKIFKPTDIDSEFETRHIFQPREVDQRCVALVKARPEVSRLMLRAAARLRVVFICIVNRDGSVEGIRLIESSGSRDLDSASAEALKDWRFSPALRRGHAVRQWVQQSFLYKVEKGSPLEVH
ncbi:MAG: energy transducer TonB [Opitutus sp.]